MSAYWAEAFFFFLFFFFVDVVTYGASLVSSFFSSGCAWLWVTICLLSDCGLASSYAQIFVLGPSAVFLSWKMGSAAGFFFPFLLIILMSLLLFEDWLNPLVLGGTSFWDLGTRVFSIDVDSCLVFFDSDACDFFMFWRGVCAYDWTFFSREGVD